MQRYGFRHYGANTSAMRLYDVEILNKQRRVTCFIDHRRSATYTDEHHAGKAMDLGLCVVWFINKHRCSPCVSVQRRSATTTAQLETLLTFKRSRYGSHRCHGVKSRANCTRSILPLGCRGKPATKRIYLGCMKLGRAVRKYSFS